MPAPADRRPVLVTFSHLRWNFVYQRPQHLMSRLARHWRVLFIEEPQHCDGPPRLQHREPQPGVTVLVPQTPLTAPGFHEDQLAVLEPLLLVYLQEQHLAARVGWLYTPMALPLVRALTPTCLVYDCMDELSAFKDAPRQLQQRESAVLRQADVVFTGGPSLYEAKRAGHHNLHCLPSAVDAKHFEPGNLCRGSTHETQAATLQGHLPRPRLGFFGVIDERMDLPLLAALADARPGWHIVMVGPVVKIDPSTLPQRPNIHWLGMQAYDTLPYLLAGWDVCLMPFAINESTRFISPTKTLEYLAGEKPVVSTPVRDVALLYGHVVRIAASAPAFVAACEATLAASPAERSHAAMEARRTVATQSWDRTATDMHLLLKAALTPERAPAAAFPRQPAPALATAAR
jgi:glycosyltransferase involved in cell wall biosynthesis